MVNPCDSHFRRSQAASATLTAIAIRFAPAKLTLKLWEDTKASTCPVLAGNPQGVPSEVKGFPVVAAH